MDVALEDGLEDGGVDGAASNVVGCPEGVAKGQNRQRETDGGARRSRSDDDVPKARGM